ncbi:MAG: hypothetical protein ACE14S_08735 [Candidatus Bathyarchaeia archaeon]
MKPQQINNYNEARKANLHSILQYALIHAGINCGFVAVPEYKVSLKEGIDPEALDIRFHGKRKQWQLKADVAFLKGPVVVGLGEIYTLDEIHGCQSSSKMITPWITPRDKLLHLTSFSKKKQQFLILVNVFPEETRTERLPWKDCRTHSIKEWKNLWKELADELNAKGLSVRMACISEKGIELYSPLS